MKSSNNLELILFTKTSFAKRELCERNDCPAERKLSPADELEKACWSGLLFEMLPDVFDSEKQNLFVWKINQAEQFIRVVMGEAPPSIDYEASIDPHFFLPYTLLYC